MPCGNGPPPYGVDVGVCVSPGGNCPGRVGPGWVVAGVRIMSWAIAVPVSSTKSTTIMMNVGRRTARG